MKNILLIDNYDSFIYNLKHLFLSNNCKLSVRRNDEDFIKDLYRGIYDGVVIGPGPGSVEDERYFGNNYRVIREFNLPILGVCLGFQGIIHELGGTLKVCKYPFHGKLSSLNISESVLLNNIPQYSKVMRYHSIMADKTLPCLRLTSFVNEESVNGAELMSFEHKERPLFGVHYHPESFATEHGDLVVKNFLGVIN